MSSHHHPPHGHNPHRRRDSSGRGPGRGPGGSQHSGRRGGFQPSPGPGWQPRVSRQEIVTLLAQSAGGAPAVGAEGILWLAEDGWGELRRPEVDFAARADNVVITPAVIARHRLQSGMHLSGRASLLTSGAGRAYRLLEEVATVGGVPTSEAALRPRVPFKELTCVDPTERLRLAEGSRDLSLRLVDLLTPIGKGQRSLIVAPPRTGKTLLLQRLAGAISRNHPEVHLMVLLVDERPEEATDWKRMIRGEVLSSTSDAMAANHVALTEVVLERARRLVEDGRDVVLLLDSLTRLGRAHNLETRNSGRTLSGGIDARTLEKPKAFFGAARKTEEAGSLTIIATALIETGSRMDEVIFEELKGTGNMELVLSRRLADLRLYPAIDIHLSGTRKEEKMLSATELQLAWGLRRILQGLDAVDGAKLLHKKLAEHERPEELLALLKSL